MGEAIDQLSKALASGASRRAALGGALVGVAAILPWTAEAKNRKRRRKQRHRAFRRYHPYCQSWCADRFLPDAGAAQQCTDDAKQGRGACYAASEQGPGYFCHKVKKCGDGKYCCPSVLGGSPVTEGTCCPTGSSCAFINGTAVTDLCVA